MTPEDTPIPRWLEAFPPGQRAKVLAAVEEIVAQSPPMTEEIKAKLRAIFSSGARTTKRGEVA